MSQVTIDELQRAIAVLKLRADEQKRLLEKASGSPAADALRGSLRSILDKVYRMSAVRDAMAVTRPYGFIH